MIGINFLQLLPWPTNLHTGHYGQTAVIKMRNMPLYMKTTHVGIFSTKCQRMDGSNQDLVLANG